MIPLLIWMPSNQPEISWKKPTIAPRISRSVVQIAASLGEIRNNVTSSLQEAD